MHQVLPMIVRDFRFALEPFYCLVHLQPFFQWVYKSPLCLYNELLSLTLKHVQLSYLYILSDHFLGFYMVSQMLNSSFDMYSSTLANLLSIRFVNYVLEELACLL
jgi:hypothetical protein